MLKLVEHGTRTRELSRVFDGEFKSSSFHLNKGFFPKDIVWDVFVRFKHYATYGSVKKCKFVGFLRLNLTVHLTLNQISLVM